MNTLVFSQLVIVIWIAQVPNAKSVSIETDLIITLEQKQILDKFRELMSDQLPHEYMKNDIYLIRWLRAKDFNIVDAKEMLLKNLEWREKNRIDSILEEDFSDVESDYKYYIDTYEMNGRTGVLVYLNFGMWNLRQAILQGKREHGLRYLDKYLEDVTTRIRTLQSEGYNVTQYDFVLNMQNFNLMEHLCIQCMPSYAAFIFSYENHYPGAANYMIFINAPAAFDLLLNSIKGLLHPMTREAIKVYGTNKAQWQPILFQIIPRDSLPDDIGGTKILDD